MKEHHSTKPFCTWACQVCHW